MGKLIRVEKMYQRCEGAMRDRERVIRPYYMHVYEPVNEIRYYVYLMTYK